MTFGTVDACTVDACHAGFSILSQQRMAIRVGCALVTLDDGYDRWGCQGQGHKPCQGTTEQTVADTCSIAAGDTLFLTPATPAGDEGHPKTFLTALGRQRNDGNRANGDILYRAKSGYNVKAQRGYQATFCFQHPLSPSTDQRGTPTTPCFRRT